MAVEVTTTVVAVVITEEAKADSVEARVITVVKVAMAAAKVDTAVVVVGMVEVIEKVFHGKRHTQSRSKRPSNANAQAMAALLTRRTRAHAIPSTQNSTC